MDDQTREALRALAERSGDALWSFRTNAGGQSAFKRHAMALFDAIGVIGKGASNVVAMLGGNRSGKSEVAFFLLAWYAIVTLKSHKPRTGITPILWVVCKGYEECGEIAWKQKLSKFIHPRNIDGIKWRSSMSGWPAMIRLKNGVEIHFKSWEQGRDAFQGSAIMGALFDEQFPPEVLQEVATRCTDFGAPILIALTPVDPDTALQRIYDSPPDNWRFFHSSIDENRKSRGGHIADADVDRVIASWPEEIRDTRRHGHFAAFAGAVYRTFKRSIHVVDDRDDDLYRRISHDWWRGMGIDFGFTNPCAFVWGARDPDGRWLIYDEHYEAEQGIEYHAMRVKSMMMEHGQDGRAEVLRTIYADPGDSMPVTDPAWRTSARAELSKHGIQTTNPFKDLHRGVELVQTAMRIRSDGRPGLVISMRCPNLIRELQGYRYPPATHSKNARDVPLDKDNHAADALRYLIASYDRMSGPVDLPKSVDGARRTFSGALVPTMPRR